MTDSRQWTPALDLEPGPLRDELFPELAEREAAAREQAQAEELQRRAAEHAETLVFSGDGAEYFRIWIVNLLLTMVTLGVYSAWAKVRKTRYFWRNTSLYGHRFDFHGSPWSVLRGRIIALLMIVAYTWAFDFSAVAGLVTVGLLCALAPLLFLRAQQFKLGNTSYRGLRFHLDAQSREAYRRLLPLPLLWFSVTVASASLGAPTVVVGALSLLVLILFPWMHHQLKQFQHGHAQYGSLSASFDPCWSSFYSAYFIAAVMMAGVSMTLIFLMMAISGPMAPWLSTRLGVEEQTIENITAATGVIAVLVSYLSVWPYFATRLQQAVWESTSMGPVRFCTYIKASELLVLVLKCALLTVLTLGLYWPFAAIRLARYRIQCLELRTTLPPDQIVGDVRPRAPGATGDGAADFFGLDVGL